MPCVHGSRTERDDKAHHHPPPPSRPRRRDSPSFPLRSHSTALAALATTLLAAAAAATTPPPAAAAAKVRIKNPKTKVEKESRSTLLAKAKDARLAELRAKATAARTGGGKVALGY